VSNYLEDFFDARKAKKRLSPEEQQKESEQKLVEQRQRIINYKKFFGEDHGRAVMLDIMNKYYILTPLPVTAAGLPDPIAEGKRCVVLDLLSRANVNMEQLDKILKGEFV
jgi:hypothetical protein